MFGVKFCVQNPTIAACELASVQSCVCCVCQDMMSTAADRDCGHMRVMLCASAPSNKLLLPVCDACQGCCVPQHRPTSLCCQCKACRGCYIDASRNLLAFLCRSGKPCSAVLIQNLFQLLALSKSLKVRSLKRCLTHWAKVSNLYQQLHNNRDCLH